MHEDLGFINKANKYPKTFNILEKYLGINKGQKIKFHIM